MAGTQLDAEQVRRRFARRFYLSEAIGFGLGVPLAAVYGLTLEPALMAAVWRVIAILTAGVVVLVAYPMNVALVRRNGRLIQGFYEGTLSKQESQEGFLRLIRLPFFQSAAIFIRVGFGAALVIAYLVLYLHTSAANAIVTAVFAAFGIYVAALVNYLVVFALVEPVLKDMIAAEVLPPEVVLRRRFFGLSFTTRTFLLILVPVLIGYLNVAFLAVFYMGGLSPQMFQSRLVQILAVNAVSFLLGFLVLMTTQRRIIRRLTGSLEILARSEGDLRARIPTALEDEFGYIAYQLNAVFRTVRDLIARLRQLADEGHQLAASLEARSGRVSETVDEMGQATGALQQQIGVLDREISESTRAAVDISRFIEQVGSRIEDQAASVAESSAAVEQTMASITNLTRIAEGKQEVIQRLTELARVGESNMSNLALSIQDIAKSAAVIQEMMEVINAVAKQTDLLAMNAAIEAAHAEEYGKGFAVVADEMRQLAEATRSNAHSIGRSLGAITSHISSSTQVSQETGSSIGQMIRSITELADSMNEMVAGMQEISSGSGQVIEALEELVRISEDVRESSADMDSRVKTIEGSMQGLSHLSERNARDVEGISAGLGRIEGDIRDVATLGASNAATVKSFEAMISGFRVDGAQAPARAEAGPGGERPPPEAIRSFRGQPQGKAGSAQRAAKSAEPTAAEPGAPAAATAERGSQGAATGQPASGEHAPEEPASGEAAPAEAAPAEAAPTEAAPAEAASTEAAPEKPPLLAEKR